MAKHGGKGNRVIWAGSDILFDIQICPPDDDDFGEDGESELKTHVSNIFDCCSFAKNCQYLYVPWRQIMFAKQGQKTAKSLAKCKFGDDSGFFLSPIDQLCVKRLRDCSNLI
ncbi:hypothetical protein TcasGA2_TC000392 [Tribolium castaneum]|uniref:Uncharacterized protein n=1 Tax=Tribolium castaneum TaxID=7070 RepID=D6WAI7_TRICA|nr:hypothetical protein TcasGA2_TC000392 [Tribolium castaneum]